MVSNTHHDSLQAGYSDEVYLPTTAANEKPSMTVLLRSELPATETAAQLRKVVRSLDATATVTRMQTLEQVVAPGTETYVEPPRP